MKRLKETARKKKIIIICIIIAKCFFSYLHQAASIFFYEFFKPCSATGILKSFTITLVSWGRLKSSKYFCFVLSEKKAKKSCAHYYDDAL
jgi:hypothetical protein